jgi:hypothetical protein
MEFPFPYTGIFQNKAGSYSQQTRLGRRVTNREIIRPHLTISITFTVFVKLLTKCLLQKEILFVIFKLA